MTPPSCMSVSLQDSSMGTFQSNGAYNCTLHSPAGRAVPFVDRGISTTLRVLGNTAPLNPSQWME
ncbi:hypothetical protein BCON_0133g00120 [Botryotinia convoluta]|uniref:Uncharacterized protein n=1 Tax=Botryotinia convoluta TaxID=54673 RepID=A0A4Z1I8E5_9HELO|nr:hypothetical protein BCON_0133g00120 [Botryotinia convoluta]